MDRTAIWRLLASEHFAKARTTEDPGEAALHLAIASDLHVKALTAEIGGNDDWPPPSANLDDLRSRLRVVFSRD